MTTTEQYTIHEVICMISNKQIQIPIFQRRYEWKKKQVEELFSTVFDDNPFGAISVVKTTNDYKIFPIRPLFKNIRDKFKLSKYDDGKNYDDKNPLYLILDGQQRLQSLFLGLTAEYDDAKLYFNKFDGSFKYLNEQEFDNQINEYISVNELYSRFTNHNCDYKNVANIYKTSDDNNVNVQQNIFKFFYHFFYQKRVIMLLAYPSKLSEADDKLKMLELFRRINRGGVKLSDYDYIVSIWQAFNPEMETLFVKLNKLNNSKILRMEGNELWVKIILSCYRYNLFRFGLRIINEDETPQFVQIAEKCDVNILFEFIRSILKISHIFCFTDSYYWWYYLIDYLYNTKVNLSHKLCENVARSFEKMFSVAFVDDINTKIFVYFYLKSSIVDKFDDFDVVKNEETHVYEIIRINQWTVNYQSNWIVEQKDISSILDILLANSGKVSFSNYRHNYKFKFHNEIIKQVTLEKVQIEYENTWKEKETIIEKNSTNKQL